MSVSQSNMVFAPVVFTATGVSAPIQLSPSQAGANGAYKRGNITLTGVSLTTVTFGVLGSSDGGQTYDPILISLVNTPGTTATTATATQSGLYRINLSGITHVMLSVSGTFTATSTKFTLTASPNASDL